MALSHGHPFLTVAPFSPSLLSHRHPRRVLLGAGDQTPLVATPGVVSATSPPAQGPSAQKRGGLAASAFETPSKRQRRVPLASAPITPDPAPAAQTIADKVAELQELQKSLAVEPTQSSLAVEPSQSSKSPVQPRVYKRDILGRRTPFLIVAPFSPSPLSHRHPFLTVDPT